MRNWFLLLGLATAVWAGDANRGAALLQNEGCLQCHSVNGAGVGHEASNDAPDLASRLASTYRPAALASALWNHTPAMWAELKDKKVGQTQATESDWEDIFTYLYSLQFFERPAELRRGKALLESKHCVDCHSASGTAPAPERWSGASDPVGLVYSMWNHAPEMAIRFAAYKKDWPGLSSRDFLDLTAYAQSLQNLPPNRKLSLPPAAEGRAAFEFKCQSCHRGPQALEVLLRNETWMDIGAGMWSHASAMRKVPAVTSDDMRKILAYVWDLQYRGQAGNVEQGQRTFNQKRCITCHRDAGTGAARSPRPGKEVTPFSMVVLGWGPSREMHKQMETQGIRWPDLSALEVTNLSAYLNSISKTETR
jgi:cytochrome c551/c552